MPYICFWLLIQLELLPDSLALFNAGSSIPARIAMIAITTRSSIKVNLRLITYIMECPFSCFIHISGSFWVIIRNFIKVRTLDFT